jgi:ribosome-associated protein
LNKLGIRSVRQSGDPESGWMLLDYINVIVHVFSPEARIYYDIEKFWETAEAVS